MAKVIGNGLIAIIDIVTIDVTSISLDAGERPQIDITAADEPVRSAVPGLRAVPTGSITGILGDGQIQDLEGYFTGCTAVDLTITTKQADCSTLETLVDSTIHITGFTVDASMDEAVAVTINFMLSSGGETANTFVPAAP